MYMFFESKIRKDGEDYPDLRGIGHKPENEKQEEIHEIPDLGIGEEGDLDCDLDEEEDYGDLSDKELNMLDEMMEDEDFSEMDVGDDLDEDDDIEAMIEDDASGCDDGCYDEIEDNSLGEYDEETDTFEESTNLIAEEEIMNSIDDIEDFDEACNKCSSGKVSEDIKASIVDITDESIMENYDYDCSEFEVASVTEDMDLESNEEKSDEDFTESEVIDTESTIDPTLDYNEEF